MAQHLAHVIEFAGAIAVWIRHPVVNQPELVSLGIDLDAGHHPNAFDHSCGMATVLATHQLKGKRAMLVQDWVIKQHRSARRQHELPAHVVPHQAGRHPFAAEGAVDRVRAALLAMVGKVRQRVVDRTDQQVWAVIEASSRCFHTDNSLAFSRLRRRS
jgi:hypothetical protein